MTRWSTIASAALVFASASAMATEIRHIQPRSQPLIQGGPAEVAKRAPEKRGNRATPSPVLIDHVATITADGSLETGCDNRALRDFRNLKADAGGTQ